MSAEIDHEYTDDPVCPHCGAEQRDAWEWGQDESGETECGSCCREFSYTRHVSVNWTTRKAISCATCKGYGNRVGPLGVETCPTCQGKRRIPNDEP